MCLADGFLSCADGGLSCADGLFVRFKSSFRFIFAAIAAHFKIALFILESRIHPPAGGVKRGQEPMVPTPS